MTTLAVNKLSINNGLGGKDAHSQNAILVGEVYVDSLNVWVDAAMEGSIWLRKSDFSPTIRVSAYQTQRRRDQ